MRRTRMVSNLVGLSMLVSAMAAMAAMAPVAPVSAATDHRLQSAVAHLGKDPGPAAEVTFIVTGDNRGTAKGAPLPRVVGTIFDEIGLVRPDFVLWSGDTVFGYCDTRAELEGEYNAFLAIAAKGGVPVFNVPGNHEIHSGTQTCLATSGPPPELCGPPCSEDVFKARFGELYGSFDFAGMHFIGLYTDDPKAKDEIAGDQLKWLQADLELNKNARAIFVFTHTPFYSSPHIDPKRRHAPIKNREALQELFHRYPAVKAVFSGHEHLYWSESHDKIDYFTAGGAGAPLYTTPESGGFSHYVVVRVPAQGDPGYEVIEPGHLYVEPAAGTTTEARFWLIDSTYSKQPLNFGGAETDVPASLGSCGELAVTATYPTKDQNVAVPVEIVACTPGPVVHHLRIKAAGVPGGVSVLVVIQKKG